MLGFILSLTIKRVFVVAQEENAKNSKENHKGERGSEGVTTNQSEDRKT